MTYTVDGGLVDYDVGCLTLCGIIVRWNLSACNGAVGLFRCCESEESKVTRLNQPF